MVVVWSKSAKLDLNNYYKHSKMYQTKKLKEYIINLINFTNSLEKSPFLGKKFYNYNKIIIKTANFQNA